MLKKLIKKYTNNLLTKFNYRFQNLKNEEINLFSKEDKSIIDLYARYSMTSDLRRCALLKAFHYIKDNKIHLIPANKNYEEKILNIGDVQIQGTLSGLIRKYN